MNFIHKSIWRLYMWHLANVNRISSPHCFYLSLLLRIVISVYFARLSFGHHAFVQFGTIGPHNSLLLGAQTWSSSPWLRLRIVQCIYLMSNRTGQGRKCLVARRSVRGPGGSVIMLPHAILQIVMNAVDDVGEGALRKSVGGGGVEIASTSWNVWQAKNS